MKDVAYEKGERETGFEGPGEFVELDLVSDICNEHWLLTLEQPDKNDLIVDHSCVEDSA